MTENTIIDKVTEPQVGEEITTSEDTTPSNNEEIVIPIKFNKETRQLTVREAAELAQKGLKYDIIRENYDRLKKLAFEDGKTVQAFLDSFADDKKEQKLSELIEKCNGNKDFAEHIYELERSNVTEKSDDFEEVKKYFPKIKDILDLPQEVLDKAELNGRQLLDEYLRFLLENKIAEKNITDAQKKASEHSLGSQINRYSGENMETTEFLKGLWR